MQLSAGDLKPSLEEERRLRLLAEGAEDDLQLSHVRVAQIGRAHAMPGHRLPLSLSLSLSLQTTHSTEYSIDSYGLYAHARQTATADAITVFYTVTLRAHTQSPTRATRTRTFSTNHRSRVNVCTRRARSHPLPTHVPTHTACLVCDSDTCLCRAPKTQRSSSWCVVSAHVVKDPKTTSAEHV